MPAPRVLLIGLDAAEPALLRAWAREGHLPTIRRLIDEGVATELASLARHLPDVVWPALYSSRNPAQIAAPFFISLRRDRPGFDFSDDMLADLEPFWQTAAAHGRRCIVVDAPKIGLHPPRGGIQVTGWGPHATFQPLQASPPHLVDHITSRYGRYPILTCDDHGTGAREYTRLRAALLRAVELRQRILRDLLESEPWDLFFAVFAETHCAGHQFWHLYDTSHPRHDEVPDELHSALRDVYAAVDRAIGELAAAAGPSTQLVIFSGHGMRAQHHGRDLLPTLLKWWGMHGRDNVAPDPARERTVTARRPLLDALREAIPTRWQYVVKRRLPTALERRVMTRFIGGPLRQLHARAVPMPNNDLNAAIRINVNGRDGSGLVAPGRPYRELRDFLVTRLRELINPATGKAAFEHVTSMQDEFDGDYRDRLPDITAQWDSDQPITSLYSPGYGTVVGAHNDHRTGGHSPQGFLAMSPLENLEAALEGADAGDIAPTVLRLLDVPIPAHMNGRALVRSSAVSRRASGVGLGG